MTSKERVQNVLGGIPADRTPLILFEDVDRSDVVIVRGTNDSDIGDGDKVTIREVLSPFGRAIRSGFDLNELFAQDPEAGGKELDRLCAQVKQECDEAAAKGMEGICYRLLGAEPSHATPMQYGGFYLERDRELLEDVQDAAFNLLWVDAGDEAYLDFVSDLPAHAFAWDIDATDISVVQMRAMRPGPLAAEDPTAEFLFAPKYEAVEPWIERETTNHA